MKLNHRDSGGGDKSTERDFSKLKWTDLDPWKSPI